VLFPVSPEEDHRSVGGVEPVGEGREDLVVVDEDCRDATFSSVYTSNGSMATQVSLSRSSPTTGISMSPGRDGPVPISWTSTSVV